MSQRRCRRHGTRNRSRSWSPCDGCAIPAFCGALRALFRSLLVLFNLGPGPSIIDSRDAIVSAPWVPRVRGSMTMERDGRATARRLSAAGPPRPQRPCVAPTICVPNRSARQAGTVVKPPPLILKDGFNRSRQENVRQSGRQQIYAKQKTDHDARDLRPAIRNDDRKNHARDSRKQHADPPAVRSRFEREDNLECPLNDEQDADKESERDRPSQRIEQKKHARRDGQQAQEQLPEEGSRSVNRK